MPAIGLESNERALTYMRDRVRNPQQQNPLRSGGIYRHDLFAPDGRRLAEPSRTCLSKAFYLDSQPIECLKDGRVLFAALDVRLPAPPSEVPRQLSLFRISRAQPVTITQVLTPRVQEEVAVLLDLMRLSPDGARICVPTGDAVKVVDLASGKVTATYPTDKHLAGQVIPVWRTNDEVCFVVTAGAALGSPGRPEVVLCSPSATRCLSKDWPDGVVQDLLQRGR
jgi:hypothetical protein